MINGFYYQNNTDQKAKNATDSTDSKDLADDTFEPAKGCALDIPAEAVGYGSQQPGGYRAARVSKGIFKSQTTGVQCGGKDCKYPFADARGSVRLHAIMCALPTV